MMEVMEISEELDDAKMQDEVDQIRKRNRSKAPGKDERQGIGRSECQGYTKDTPRICNDMYI